MTALPARRPPSVDHDAPLLHLVPQPGGEPRSDRRLRSRRTALRIMLVAVGWLAVAAIVVPFPSPVRPALLFGFVLLVPGAAVVLRLPSVDRVEQTMLAVALSAAVAIAVSEAFAFLHAWSPARVVTTLAIATTILVGAQRFRRARSKPDWRPLHGPYPLPPELGRTDQ